MQPEANGLVFWLFPVINSYSFLVLKHLSQDNIKTPHSPGLYFLHFQVWSNLKHKVCSRVGMGGMETRWWGQMRRFLIGTVIWGWGLLCDWGPITVSWDLLPCQPLSHPLLPPPHTRSLDTGSLQLQSPGAAEACSLCYSLLPPSSGFYILWHSSSFFPLRYPNT